LGPMKLAALAILTALSACGKGSKSQSHASPLEAGTGTTTGSGAWDFVGLRDPYAIVTRDGQSVVLDRSAKILGQPHVDPALLEHALVMHDTLVWSEGNTLHAFDLSASRERWHAEVDHNLRAIVSGDLSVAAINTSGFDIIKLSDGAIAYHQGGPATVSALFQDGVFYVGDTYGGVFAVQEATKKLLWKTSFGDVGSFQPLFSIEAGKLLVVNGKEGPFMEIDLASGKPVASGSNDTNAPGGSSLDLGRGPDGDRYQVSGKYGKARTVFALDVASRIKWTAKDWPVDAHGYKSPNATVAMRDGEHAAIVLAPIEGGRLLVGYNPSTGKPGFKQPFDDKDVLVGVSGGCVLVLALAHEHKLVCRDVSSGAATWQRALFGKDAVAWPLPAGASLVADASPPVLSRLDAAGQTVWQTTLPNSDFDRNWGWHVGTTIAVKSDGSASVIDLATGTLATAHP
jgi:outer membrane protein assembly factor BamB